MKRHPLILSLAFILSFGAVSLWGQEPTITVPVNDNFADRTEVFGTNVSISGNNILATVEPAEVGLGFDILPTTKTVWYSWTAPVDGIVTIDQIGTFYSSVISTFYDFNTSVAPSLDNLLYFGYDFDSSYGGSIITPTFYNPATGKIQNGVLKGTTIYICVYGFTDNGGSPIGRYQVNLKYTNLTPPANDNFVNRQVISGAGGVVTASNIGATLETGEPMHAGVQGGESLWYTWTAPKTGLTKIYTSSPSIKTVVGVYVGDITTQLYDAVNNNNIGVINSEVDSVTLKVLGGETYSFAVDGYQGRVGDIDLTVAQGPIATFKGSLDYGSIKTKSQKSRLLTITNNGTSSLNVKGLTLPKGFYCNFKGKIPVGASRVVRVSFKPNNKGNYGGTLSIRSNSVLVPKIAISGSAL